MTMPVTMPGAVMGEGSHQARVPTTARLETAGTDGSKRVRYNDAFEGFFYVNVGQARAREAVSDLSVDLRLYLLIEAELQRNGCVPIGPEGWTDLGVANADAEALIRSYQAVGILTNDSDIWCLHVNGRHAQRNTRKGRTRCGQAASVRANRKARPRRLGYSDLRRTERPFRPPGTRRA